MAESRRMSLIDALNVLVDLRSDEVIVATMGSAREWVHLSSHPLDLIYLPSTMGGGVPLGLGLALAQPQRHVIVLSGDGSLLMNLGSLVTAAAHPAQNLTVVVVDNGVYEVTGGQKLVTANRPVDLTKIALAAGFETVIEFGELATWKDQAQSVLSQPGPRFVSLKVAPVQDDYSVASPGPMAERIENFRKAIRVDE